MITATTKRLAWAVLVWAGLALSGAAQAAGPCDSDFEDGTLGAWLSSTTGGVGSAGVESHNGSKMAFVLHTGSGSHALSCDFAYSASQLLSFDMHAVALLGGAAQASSGVVLSFYNPVNVALGTASFVNITNPASLGPTAYAVDNLQHHYEATMAGFAALAGLDGSAAISKVSLQFYASAQTIFGCCASSSSVWFDNISVTAVPEPAVQALVLCGLAAVIGLTRGSRRGGEVSHFT